MEKTNKQIIASIEEAELINGFYKVSEYRWVMAGVIVDWNHLMSVVEKIEEMGYQFWIGKYASTITHPENKDFQINLKGDVKINVIYQIGVRFIKWYNSQK